MTSIESLRKECKEKTDNVEEAIVLFTKRINSAMRDNKFSENERKQLNIVFGKDPYTRYRELYLNNKLVIPRFSEIEEQPVLLKYDYRSMIFNPSLTGNRRRVSKIMNADDIKLEFEALSMIDNKFYPCRNPCYRMLTSTEIKFVNNLQQRDIREDYEYDERGDIANYEQLCVNSKKVFVLEVDFIPGTPLHAYKVVNKKMLLDLLQQFRNLCIQDLKMLFEEDYVNGDFSEENIIVSPKGKLIVIDHSNMKEQEDTLSYTQGSHFYSILRRMSYFAYADFSLYGRDIPKKVREFIGQYNPKIPFNNTHEDNANNLYNQLVTLVEDITVDTPDFPLKNIDKWYYPCDFVFTRGKNAGDKCGKKSLKGMNRCGMHKDKPGLRNISEEEYEEFMNNI